MFSLVFLLFGALTHGWAQCPHVSFIYADACDAPDGKGEFLVLDNDSLDLAIDDLELTTPDGTRVCNGCSNEWYLPDVSNLNTLAGCGTLFIGLGPGDSLPSSERLIVFTNRNFKDDVDWSNFCDEAPVYVVTIDQVDNTDKYTHNTGSCVSSTATTYLRYGSGYGCGLDSVEYDPCSMAVETTGSDGGWGIAFAPDGAGSSREVGCELFDIETSTLHAGVNQEMSIPTETRRLELTVGDRTSLIRGFTYEENDQVTYLFGNMQGQIVEQGSLPESGNILITSQLPAGMYWIDLHSSSQTRRSKVIIQN